MKKIFFGRMFCLCIILVIFIICVCKDLNAGAKRAIVVGASSGMGRAVAKILAKEGYILGLVSRRVHLLESLQEEIPTKSFIKRIDVSEHDLARRQLKELIDQMGGALDLILISISAFEDIQYEANEWVKEKKIIDVDLKGFWAIAHTALEHFEKQKFGHLVGISSISGLIGAGACPEYSGAKAFISKYLQGVRNKMIHKGIPIFVTDIIPGWVDVESYSLSEQPGTYWVSSVEKAACQICEAIRTKKKVAYITKRWELIASLLKANADLLDGFYDFHVFHDLVLNKD